MENSISMKITKSLILKVLCIIFACFFFIPIMTVSCSSGLGTDITIEMSAKTMTFGTEIDTGLGTQKTETAYFIIISLILPIAAFCILFIKNRVTVIVGIILNLINNILYIVYAHFAKMSALDDGYEFSYNPAFYVLMILFGSYYLVSALCLIKNDDEIRSGNQGTSANEFLGNLGQKISATSQGAMQKTKDMASVMSLNSENSGLDRKNEALFRQIGTEIYGQLFDGKALTDIEQIPEDRTIPTELWKVICESSLQIKKNSLAKSENERKILELKGELPCPKCGTMMPKSAVFCSKCGTRSPFAEDMQETVEAVQEQENMCPKCGKPLRDDAAFCKYCGTKVE